LHEGVPTFVGCTWSTRIGKISQQKVILRAGNHIFRGVHHSFSPGNHVLCTRDVSVYRLGIEERFVELYQHIQSCLTPPLILPVPATIAAATDTRIPLSLIHSDAFCLLK
jgi:hypothetical protein